MEMLLLLVLILLNGVLAMSEIAVVAARKVRLSSMAEHGDHGAGAALKLHNDPTNFLSTVQVGITSIGVLNGILGEAVLAEPIAAWLQDLGMAQAGSEVLATTLVVALITYATIVIGELVPKRIGQLKPEHISILVARPMGWLSRLTYPFVWLLTVSTEGILGLLRLRHQSTELTEEDLKLMVDQVSKAGMIHHEENQMVRNVFRLDDRLIKSLMTHRNEIVHLDLQSSLADNLDILRRSSHSVFPVCNGGLHDIVGIVNSKDLLFQLEHGEQINISLSIRTAVYLPETLNGIDLLNHFSNSPSKMALVVNEYGELQGLVTAQDVLRALVGEITEEVKVDRATQLDDGSWLIDGLIALPELMDLLALKTLPGEDARTSYHTLGGLMMQLLEHLPGQGDKVQWEGWEFVITGMDEKRVSQVHARQIVARDEPQDPA